jgi:signal transduction histidine kinase/predicted hydrocarbon binding protein
MTTNKLHQLLTESSPGFLRFGGARMALLDIEAGFWGFRRHLEALLGVSLTNSVLQQVGANGGASFSSSFTASHKDNDQPEAAFSECVQAYQQAGFGQFQIIEQTWPIGRLTVRGRDTFEAWMMKENGIQAQSPACAYTAGVLVGFINVVSDRQDVVCIEHRCQATGDEYCEFELLPASETSQQPVIAFRPYANPENQPSLQEINTALEQRVRERTEEAERRQQAAESLRDIIGMINSNMPLEEFLERAIELAASRLGAKACALHHFDLESEVITQIASFGLEGYIQKGVSRSFTSAIQVGGGVYLQATLQKKATHVNYPPLEESIAEIQRDPDMPELIKRRRIALRKAFSGVLSVPLVIQDELYGGMVFYYTEPQQFDHEQIQLGLTFADQVAVAIENARLFQEAERRRNVAESLRETLSILNTERPLEEILQHIVSQAQVLLQAKAVAIHQLDKEKGLLCPQAAIGLSPEYVANIRLPVGQGALGQAVVTRKPVAVNDTSQVFAGQQAHAADGQAIPLSSDLFSKLKKFSDRYGAVLAVPMTVNTQIYGGLALYNATPRTIQPEEIELAVTFANQASLAIENALLRAQAAEAAVLSERNRLARDLHDAVSQTLFSSSLIADVLPKLWERNPEAAQQKLNELGQLTRGALSEMRTLLLELRPATLDDIDLGDLLRHLVNAFIGRTRTTAVLEISGQLDPPAEVKSVFYRVAQEALNNIGKHAQAKQVQLHLERAESHTRLEVKDNGHGFDPANVQPESLGLGIMRERAESIGAQLAIESRLGVGAKLVLTWKQGEK